MLFMFPIEPYTTSNKKGLKSFLFPSNITSIGNSAFFNCKTLTGLLTIPSTVTTIERGAFEYCSGIHW